MNEIIIVSLLFSLLLFPVVAMFHKKTAIFLYYAVGLLAIIYYMKEEKEAYDRMDFFPWNEVNLVKKRTPNSTVIDCAWYLDHNKTDNIFKMSDPVVAKYTNLPEQ